MGKVFSESGKENKDYMTYRSKNVIYIRGNEESPYRKCDLCGRELYHPIGKRYLSKAIPENLKITESQLHKLIIFEEIFNRINIKQWKKLSYEELNISAIKDGRDDLIL